MRSMLISLLLVSHVYAAPIPRPRPIPPPDVTPGYWMITWNKTDWVTVLETDGTYRAYKTTETDCKCRGHWWYNKKTRHFYIYEICGTEQWANYDWVLDDKMCSSYIRLRKLEMTPPEKESPRQ